MTERRFGDASAHPPAAQLLLYSEGDLPPSQAETVRRHLVTCDICQQAIRDVDDTIEEVRDQQSEVHREEPPEWRRFPSQLRTVARDVARQESRAHLPSATLLRWAAIVLVGLGAATVVNRLSPRVSAQVLIERSVSFERARSPATSLRVGIRVGGPLADRLQCAIPARNANGNGSGNGSGGSGISGPSGVRHLATRRLAEWESHAPVAVARAAAATSLDRPSFLCSYDPLSARRFQAWMASLAKRSEQVTDDGRTVVVSIESEAGALRRATLTLRRDTNQPIAQRLFFADQSEVELWLIDEITVDPTPQPLQRAANDEEASTPPATVDANAGADAIDSDQAELDARLGLNRLGADLGEDLTVRRRDDGRVEIGGTVQTSARRAELVDGLKSIAGVSVNVRAAEELTPASAASAGPAVPIGPSPVDEPVLLSWLQESFATPADREAYVAGALTRSDAVVNRTLALATLAERYPPASAARLSPRARAALETLVQDHQSGLRTATAELAAHMSASVRGVRPDGFAMPRVSAGNEAAGAWQLRTSADVAAARTVNQAVLELLTTHTARASTISPIVRLEDGLGRLGTK